MSASRGMPPVVAVITALNLRARRSARRTLPSRANPARRNRSPQINPISPHFCCGRFAHGSDGKTLLVERIGPRMEPV
jgi:hypothetical protein